VHGRLVSPKISPSESNLHQDRQRTMGRRLVREEMDCAAVSCASELAIKLSDPATTDRKTLGSSVVETESTESQ
jgi:hypothetical protein